jgi:hypothetical protein
MKRKAIAIAIALILLPSCGTTASFRQGPDSLEVVLVVPRK